MSSEESSIRQVSGPLEKVYAPKAGEPVIATTFDSTQTELLPKTEADTPAAPVEA
jgi:hypothetical protein